jgi:hypothetical protein
LLAAAVRDAGVYVNPTNIFFLSSFGEKLTEDQYRQRPDYAYIPPGILQEKWAVREHYWKNAPPVESRDKYVRLRKQMTYELWKAGVPLMAGSDSPEWFLAAGFSIHDELETFVNAGLTPFAALRAATVNPASHLGIIKRTGTIETGKEADLLLLDKNPLDDIRNTRAISGVFTNGTWFDRAGLDRMLAQAKQEMEAHLKD